MAKNTYYFPHDYHARHDPKLERLRMEIGPVGDGIYWDIVEMLYEQEGYLDIKDIPLIAKSINTTDELLQKVVNESELFVKNGQFFYSESLLARLKHINLKRRKARASAKLSHSANAQRTHSERSAIKESKVKESKVNNKEIIHQPSATLKDILQQVNIYINIYSLINRLKKEYKDKKALELYIPDEVLIKVCNTFLRTKEGIQEPWPWFCKAIQEAWRDHNAFQVQKGNIGKRDNFAPAIKEILSIKP